MTSARFSAAPLHLAMLLLSLVALAGATAPVHAHAKKANKVCKQCRVQCQEGVDACAAADPRLATCPAKRQKACMRRAKKACKKNLKTCCSRYCQDTGLVQCCGSATSAIPPSRGGPTTTTSTTLSSGGGGTTTTTTAPPGSVLCSVDDDCPTCQCCTLGGVCGGVTGSGAGNCCNLSGQPPSHLFGACGPNTPDPCPPETMCVPGTQQGEIRYHCGYCAGSNKVVGVFTMSGGFPPISQPSNACTRQ